MMFGCGCGAGPIANLRGGGGPSLSPVGLDLQRASEKWAGGKALQCRPGACHAAQYICTLGTQSSPQAFNQYPLPSPLTLSNVKTCRITLPIGTPAEDCHTYTQYTPIKSTRIHECVQHSPTQSYSVLV